MPLSLCLTTPLSLSHNISLSLSHNISLSLSISQRLSLCLTTPLSLSVSQHLSLSVSQSPPPPLPLSLFVCRDSNKLWHQSTLVLVVYMKKQLDKEVSIPPVKRTHYSELEPLALKWRPLLLLCLCCLTPTLCV